MANELNIALTTGLTVTVQPYAAGAASGSAISLSEVGSSGFYTGNMTGSAGTYQLVFLSGGATVGTGQIVWSGTAEVPVSTLTTGDLPSVPSVSDIRTELSVELGRIDASVSSRSTLTTGDLPSVPSAASVASAVRTELTEISNLDASVSSRLAAADYTAPTAAPTAAAVASAVRSELTEISNLDASISSRLASASYTAPANSDISAIKAKTDNLPASPAAVSDIPTTAQISAAVEGSLLDENDGQAVLNAIVGAIGNQNVDEIALVAAIRSDLERTGGKLDSIPTDAAPSAASVASAVWSAATKEITGGTVDNLTNAPASVTPADIWTYGTREITGGTVDTLVNAPSVPSASAIADEVRLELAPELSNLDAPVSGATAPTASTVASQVRTELTAELAKVSALNTERLANVATTAIVGNLIAQANS